MLSDRANALCLLEILREYSDEQHILPMREITRLMNCNYGLKPDRRTVYSAVAALQELGYDISLYEENGKGYYLRQRDLEQAEVLLLMEAVHSFSFIPAKQSEDLIGKLQKQLSVHQRRQYKHLSIVRQDKKTANRQVFWNIDCLEQAVAEQKQVRFTYLQYGADKRLHPHRNSPYTVNPYGMVYMNEHYYLICNLSGYPNNSLYRIDLMQDIELLECEWDKQPCGEDEVRDAVFAHIGASEHILLHCSKEGLDGVLDKFGTEVFVTPLGEKDFAVRLKAPPRGIKYWALQYLPYVEVIEPAWLRQEIVDVIKNNKYEASLQV